MEQEIVNALDVAPVNLAGFHTIAGAFAGRIVGNCNLDDIKQVIKTYDQSVNTANLNIVIIDYDTSVYFYALDVDNVTYKHTLTLPAIKDSIVEVCNFGAQAPNNSGRREETHDIYRFTNHFVETEVEKLAASTRTGLIVTFAIERDRSVTIESPFGHAVTFVYSAKFAGKLTRA